MDKDTRTKVHRAIEIAGHMGTLLAGEPAAVQGAALAQCLARWVAGHSPEIRDGVLADHIASVHRMVDVMLRGRWDTQEGDDGTGEKHAEK